nr:EOG090X0272 [Lepidurus arcticus]
MVTTVYGKLGTHGSEEIFEWNHSYSKVYQPKGKYNPRGVFMYFENYNVEVRDRVKCISAIEGVPVSTQWDANGYFYPIQIAQFGLSHFSKNLTDAQPRVTILEDGYSSFADWVAAEDSVFKRRKEGTYHVLNFSVKDPTTPGIVARVDKLHPSLLILQCVIKMVGNGSLAVAIEDKDRGYTFSVIYTCSQDLLTVQGNDVIYGLGDCAPDQWHYLTRDLAIDLLKGHVVAGRGKKISRPHLRLLSLTLKGQGQITNLSFSSSAHDSQFKSASEWLVKHQDTVTGGWPIPVRRRFGPGIQDLDPGWISAMGQGQAMSLLVRAYNRTGDEAYLRAALNAVKPFQVASSDGGVLAKFMNMYVWYEEYPTTPPSFVLNGFIYSLIGLYDLLTVADQFQSVKRIFDAGMASLKKLLPLYDTGSGSTYDLRHVMLGSAPNIARWDYHSTHVNQLLLLSTIDKDPILKTTAHRWMSYMKGKRAPHN